MPSIFSAAHPTHLFCEFGPDGHYHHVLSDKPLARGEFVEVLMPRGVWVRATYDWDQPYSDDHYDLSNPPIFTFPLGGTWEEDSTRAMPTFTTCLPQDAVLRHIRVRHPRPPRTKPRRSSRMR